MGGATRANSTLLMKVADIRMRVLTHTKLGNLATRAHIVLTDCFFMIDWRLPCVKQRRGNTHYHAGTITHYFLSYNLCLYQANDMMSYHFCYLYD